MEVNVFLNEIEEDMIDVLYNAEGARLTKEEYVQRLFSNSLWVLYDMHHKKMKEKENG